MKRLAIIGALFAALFLAPSLASAADEFATPTIETVTGNAVVSGTATNPILTVSGDGEATVYYGITINVCGSIPCTYHFVPYTPSFVPLTVSYSLSASAGSGQGQGIAEIGIYDVTKDYGFGDGFNCSFDGGRCGSVAPTNVSFDYEILYCGGSSCDFQGTAYVYLHALANAGGSAEVDPTFSIDPAFLAANPNATLTVASVPLTAGVPEPASWALMLAGFGGLGAMARRRRLAVTSARA